LIKRMEQLDVVKRVLVASMLRAYMLSMCKDADNDDINFAQELQVFSQSVMELTN